MNVFANTWRQLVRRRLWPVAALLLAGLVAVPLVLAKDPEPVVMPPPPAPEETTAAEEAATGEPLVALTEQGDQVRRRRVLGARKDPFEVAPPPKAKKSQEQAPAEQEPETDKPEAPSDPSGGAPSLPGPVLPPVETPVEPEKKKTYPPDSLIVRFGDPTSGELDRGTLTKLSPLPADTGDEAQPVLVYTGLTKDGKHAIFMVDAAAEATGDGECKPHPSNCETIHLRKGETEFFDIKDEEGNVVAQYQLDLIDINTRKKPAATRSRAKATAKANISAGSASIGTAGL
jgi:hypothetical protein